MVQLSKLWRVCAFMGFYRRPSFCRRMALVLRQDVDTVSGERVWLPLPGCRQMVSDSKGVPRLCKCFGKVKDTPTSTTVPAHHTQQAVIGRGTMVDFQGNQEADVVANLGAAEHVPHEPSAGCTGHLLSSRTFRSSCQWKCCLRRPMRWDLIKE
eukprot:5415717-Amphidinium_carterae.1